MQTSQQWWHSDPAAAQPGPVFSRQPPPETAAHAEATRLENEQRRLSIAEAQRRAAREIAATNPGSNASPADRRQAQALIEGRMPWPTGRAMTDPHIQQIIAIATEMDPNLDAATQARRRAGILAFTGNSPGAKLVGSVNRIANHLDDLYNLSERLAGPNVLGNRQLSSAAAYLGQSQEGPDLAAYNTAVQQVAGELEKIATNSPGTLTGREETIGHLSPNQSLEARRAAIREVVSLIHGAIEPLQNQYNSSFQEGTSRPAVPWITPRAREIYQTIGGVDMSLPGAPGEAGTAGDPGAPPIVGGPPNPGGGAPPGTPPISPNAGPSEHLDTHQQQFGPRGPDSAELATGSLYTREADPALAGVNAHVAQLMGDHTVPNADIVQYIQDRGIPVNEIPNLPAALAFRQAHPGYRGGYDVQLDQHMVPQSATRFLTSTLADSPVGAYAAAAGNMVTGQQIPNLIGATGGDAELARVGLDEVRNRHPLASVAGDVSGGALAYGGGGRLAEAGTNALERAAPSLYSRLPAWVQGGERATGTLAPRAIAGDAALGAYESPGNRTEGALIGAGTGVGVRGAFNTVGRAVSPTGGALAPAYEEGVQPTLGQRMGGAANRVEQAFQSVPIVGGIQRGARRSAQDQWQLGGFNKALRNLPGDVQLPATTGVGPMAVGTAPHDFSQTAFNDAYTRVHKRISVVPDAPLEQGLADLRQEATTTLSDPSLSHFNRILDNSVLRRLTVPDKAISGSDLQDMLSEVRRTASGLRSSPTGDRELASTLDDLSQTIYDNAARHSPPEAMATLNNINRGYGMLARIETAANRAGAGDAGEYTPRALLNAERQRGGLRGRQFLAGNGLMTDYAQAGMKLGQTVADSGTPERQIATGAGGLGVLGALGGAGYAGGTAGIIPAALYGVDTLASTPWGRKAVDFALRPNRPAIRPFTDEIRAQIQSRAYLGSAIGAPAVVSAYYGK